MRRMSAGLATIASLSVVALGCEPQSQCDADDLQQTLDDAGEGDEVLIGACHVTGSLTVPAGVTLRGQGALESVIVGDGEGPVVVLEPGNKPTRLVDLSVESTGRAAVLAVGEGSASIEGARITASRGIGIGAEGLDSLVVSEVDLAGPVTEANSTSLAPDVGIDETATHGLVVVRVDSAQLEALTVTGFAMFGVLEVGSTVEWDGGAAYENLGVGMMAQGGSVDLSHVALTGTFQGLRLIPPYGGVFVGGVTVQSDRLEVTNNDAYGLLHDGVVAAHTDLIARDNGDVAVWAQSCESFDLVGARTEITSNRFAGVVLYQTEAVTLQGARIDSTSLATRVFEETGAIDVGDGVQIVDPMGEIDLDGIELSGNERVGVLVALAEEGSTDEIRVSDLSVDGTGSALGVVAQGGTVTPGWDSGVTRGGATVANDAAFEGMLQVVGIIGDSGLPRVDDVVDEGLAGIIGDSG